jgi:hypothetical protein
LPPLPEACRKDVGIVIPKKGEKWRAVQLRWEIVAENENDVKKMCADLYEGSAARLAATPPSLP